MLIQFVLYCCWYQPPLASVCKSPSSLVSLELLVREGPSETSKSHQEELQKWREHWFLGVSVSASVSASTLRVACSLSHTHTCTGLRVTTLPTTCVCACLHPSPCLPPRCLFSLLRNMESPAAFMLAHIPHPWPARGVLYSFSML